MDGRGKKMPESIRIKRAKSGGYIATHDYNNFGSGESYTPSEDHVITGDEDDLAAHVVKHMGGKASGNDKVAGVSSHKPTTTLNAAKAGVGHKPTKKAPGPKTYGVGVD